MDSDHEKREPDQAMDNWPGLRHELCRECSHNGGGLQSLAGLRRLTGEEWHISATGAALYRNCQPQQL